MKSSWQSGFDYILEAGTAKSTRRAHLRDIQYFTQWMRLSCNAELTYPVPLDHVIGFVVEHAGHMSSDIQFNLIKQGLKRKASSLSPRSIRRMIGSLSAAHIEQGVTNPCANAKVRLLLKKLTIAYDYVPHKKVPITSPVLDSLLETCHDSLVDIRDRALLQLAVVSGGRRRSELSVLCVDDLIDIEGGYLIHLSHSKTDQDGEGTTVPLLGKAAVDLKAWLVASGIRSGKLFRGIHRSGTLRKGISGDTINRIVKHRAKLAGYDDALFSAHCLRSGFVTQAGRDGVHVKDAMALSGHKDVVVAHQYYKDAELLSNPARYLFNSKHHEK